MKKTDRIIMLCGFTMAVILCFFMIKATGDKNAFIHRCDIQLSFVQQCIRKHVFDKNIPDDCSVENNALASCYADRKGA